MQDYYVEQALLKDEKEDHPSIVPENEYLPELEGEVSQFMGITPDLPVNKKLYTRNKIPERMSDKEAKEWKLQEYNRCKMGHDGMSGKQYFYYHYGWIQQIEGGRITPDYRVCDDVWYRNIEEVQGIHWDLKQINGMNIALPVNKSKGDGLVCVKRRRGGFSWKEAMDALHDSSFIPFFNTGMNSMSERDSIILFNKVKFLYDNIEPAFRVTTTAGKTKSSMDFSYYKRDIRGNKIKRGTQSNIVVVPPTDSAYEGWMLNKWACDEAGKIPNLEEMWTYTEDCMMQETLRKGTPIIFGTSGDIGTVGRGLKELWENSDVYRLKKFFFGGWMGILCDQYGNDLREHAIRWIIYERHRRKKLSLKKQNQFKQKYPLTIDEAFAESGVTGLGDTIKLQGQRNILIDHPIPKIQGFFKDIPNGDVEFINSNEGDAIMYGKPTTLRGGCVASCDPADHDDPQSKNVSDLSLLIMSKHLGVEPPKLLLDYTCRPRKLAQYYTQAGLALRYFDNTRILIERNRFRMISEFERMGLKHLIYGSPQRIMKLVGGKVNTMGVHMTTAFKTYVEGLVEAYVDDYCDYIPSIELIDDLLKYDPNSDTTPDRVIAFMLCCAMLFEDRSRIRAVGETSRKLRMPSLVRGKDGIIRQSYGKSIGEKQRPLQQGGVSVSE